MFRYILFAVLCAVVAGCSSSSTERELAICKANEAEFDQRVTQMQAESAQLKTRAATIENKLEGDKAQITALIAKIKSVDGCEERVTALSVLAIEYVKTLKDHHDSIFVCTAGDAAPGVGRLSSEDTTNEAESCVEVGLAFNAKGEPHLTDK